MSTGRNPLITKIALAILDANNIFIVNALFEGIFPFLNLLMSDSTGSPLLFPYMVSQPDPVSTCPWQGRRNAMGLIFSGSM